MRAVVRAHLPALLRAARAAGLAEEEARDAVQSAFMVFVEKLPSFEGRSHPRTWLFGILYHKIQETYRMRRRDGEVDDIDAVLESRFDASGSWTRPPRDLSRELESREIGRAIDDCLENVPVKQRVAFALREIQGFSTDELCGILEVTAGNLGVMLHRARNRLRECLEARGLGAG